MHTSCNWGRKQRCEANTEPPGLRRWAGSLAAKTACIILITSGDFLSRSKELSSSASPVFSRPANVLLSGSFGGWCEARARKVLRHLPHHAWTPPSSQLKHLGSQKLNNALLLQPHSTYFDTLSHPFQYTHTYQHSKWHVNSSSEATSRCK
jgi:hypothetical protein